MPALRVVVLLLVWKWLFYCKIAGVMRRVGPGKVWKSWCFLKRGEAKVG